MNRNSSRICGRKTTTEPTPLHTPSISRDRQGVSGRTDWIQCPDHRPHYYPGTWYDPPLPEDQYVGTMIKGSVEVIDIPQTRWGLLHALGRWTAQVRSNNRVDARHWPEPPWLHGIKHVIYVIKENRTYDEVFGSLHKGNGDPALNLFGDSSAPNHRALARNFVLLDNFYVDAQVSQDGHPWSTQGVATDYTRKVWPFDYAWAYYRAYDSEYVPFKQQFPSEPLASDPSVRRSAAAATAGYLWDDAFNHGVSFRNSHTFAIRHTDSVSVCNTDSFALAVGDSNTISFRHANTFALAIGHTDSFAFAVGDPNTVSFRYANTFALTIGHTDPESISDADPDATADSFEIRNAAGDRLINSLRD